MADASDSSVSTSASDRHALTFEAFSQTPPKKTAEGVQIAAAEKSEEQDYNGVLEDRGEELVVRFEQFVRMGAKNKVCANYLCKLSSFGSCVVSLI